MKRVLIRRSLALVLMAVLAVAAIGLTPTPARAVTSSYLYKQVKAIKASIAKIKKTNTSQWASISALKNRMTTAEQVNATQSADIATLRTQVGATGPAGPAGPTGATGPAGPAGPSDADTFWPGGVTFVVGTPRTVSDSAPGFVNVQVRVSAHVGGEPKGSNIHAVLHLPAGDVVGDLEQVFSISPAVYTGGAVVPMEYWAEWGGVKEHKTVSVTLPTQ